VDLVDPIAPEKPSPFGDVTNNFVIATGDETRLIGYRCPNQSAVRRTVRPPPRSIRLGSWNASMPGISSGVAREIS